MNLAMFDERNRHDGLRLRWLAVPALVALLVLTSAGHAAAGKRLENGRIAFTVVRGGDMNLAATRIVTVRPNGSGRRLLPCARRYARNRCYDVEPAYSNDGGRLASLSNNAVSFSEIVIRRPSGRIVRRRSCDCFDVAWSPGRRFLAFASFEVVLIDLRTWRQRRPLRMGAAETLAWSRQGTLVADDNLGTGPFTVREPNGRRRRIRIAGQTPEWAPDGRRFAYTCSAGACVVSKTGKKNRVLPRGRRCDQFGGLAWSPDGRELACFSTRGLIAIDLQTRRVRYVAPRVFEPGSIDWQPLPRGR